MRLLKHILLFLFLVTGCATNSDSTIYQSLGVTIPRDHVIAILSESDSIVDYKIKFYSQSVLAGLDPSLGKRISEFRKEFAEMQKTAREKRLFNPILVNMPADILLLRRVVPSNSTVNSVKILNGHTYVSVDETVLDDGKVYTSSKDRIVFDYVPKDQKWQLSEVFFYRPNTEKTPLILSQFLELWRPPKIVAPHR
jgi:hypothetical protein